MKRFLPDIALALGLLAAGWIRQLDLLATLVLPTALVRSPHLTRHGGSEELGV